MAKILYKTKDNTDPKGKPRVYFTCHPEDFALCFEKIREDIFATHDCVIYYTENMTEAFDEAHLETDLGQMNLFVVPVTFRLLSQHNRSMDFDIAYAKQQNIPILPFMMEQGIDELYSKPEKFGQRQYLNPYSSDLTEIRYADKLKKYLESVLVSDEMANRVRAAFDAYIFLSYRKKDRRYANELMKLIHRNPECRDIAIWYDEFLTPGESFLSSIQKALEDSKLFTLLVTPNLLEESDGKPNFVMGEEYPAAVKAGKEVFPAEMVKTDHAALASKFRDIPDCADPQDEAAFKQRLIQTIQRVAVTSNKHDPEHNFLIGLAYLEGIDVEVNRQRGIELITMAAEADLPEAMLELHRLEKDVLFHFNKALYWAERLERYCVMHFGYQDERTLNALSLAAMATGFCMKHDLCTVRSARALYFHQKQRGWDHPETLAAMSDLANRIGWDERKRVYKLQEIYGRQKQVLGEKHPYTLTSLSRLAAASKNLGDYQAALKYYNQFVHIHIMERKQVSAGTCDTIVDLYAKVGDAERESNWRGTADAIRNSNAGKSGEIENVEQLLAYLNLFANTISEEEYWESDWRQSISNAMEEMLNAEKDVVLRQELGQFLRDYFFERDYSMELSLCERVFEQKQQFMGDNHPETLEAMEDLHEACQNAIGHDNSKAIEIFKKLAHIYLKVDKVACSIQCQEQLIALLEEQHGPGHESLRYELWQLAGAYQKKQHFEKAIEVLERLCTLSIELYGREHLNVVSAMEWLMSAYYSSGQLKQALKICGDALELSRRALGADNVHTLQLQKNLLLIQQKIEE